MTATMPWSAFAFLITGVLLNAGAQLLLKAGTNVLGVITLTRDNWWDTFWRMGTQGYFVAGVAFYMVSLVVWIMGLSRVPVSVAYPMLSLGYVINAVAAYYLFGEAVSATRWLGIGFIVVGVWLVARS
jgi:multidrug transporter EmrE-like cation transporter